MTHPTSEPRLDEVEAAIRTLKLSAYADGCFRKEDGSDESRTAEAALLALYRPAGESRDWSAELHALAGMECLNEDGAKGDDQYSCNQECVTCCARREVERLSAAPAGETRAGDAEKTYREALIKVMAHTGRAGFDGHTRNLSLANGLLDSIARIVRAALPPSHAGDKQ